MADEEMFSGSSSGSASNDPDRFVARVWVDPKLLSIPSRYPSSEALGEAYDGEGNWELSSDDSEWFLVAPRSGDRICDRPTKTEEGEHYFFMYKNFFTDQKVRFPFSKFEMLVLRYLGVAPSQLHPNAWGFMKVFKIILRYVGLSRSARVFFYCFQVSPHVKGRFGHVSFRASAEVGQVFKQYCNSYKDWLDSFFWVSPALAPGQLPFFIEPKTGEYKFELYWNDAHYEVPVKKFSSKFSSFTGAERRSLRFFAALKERRLVLPTRKIVDYGGGGRRRERV